VKKALKCISIYKQILDEKFTFANLSNKSIYV